MAEREELIIAALTAAQNAERQIPGAVSEWLADNVDPETGYVLDSSLTVAGAAADAKAAGDAVGELKSALDIQGYVSPWYEGVDLTLKFATEIAASPYSGNPWAWIKARIQAANFTGIHVNDYIPFTTTDNKSLKACVGGINTYKDYGDAVVGNHIDFICRELWPTRHPVNPVNFNNGTKFGDAAATEYPWLASDLYLWLNSQSGTVASATTVGGGTGTEVDYTSGGVYYYLPTNLKDVIVEKRAFLPKRYSESGLLSDDNAGGWENIGKLWLPSEFEVYGAPVWGGKGGYATMGNCVQYPIFAHNMNRVKNRSGNRDDWWVLSVYSGNTTYWCYVYRNGLVSYSYASGTNVAAPVCFRIS